MLQAFFEYVIGFMIAFGTTENFIQFVIVGAIYMFWPNRALPAVILIFTLSYALLDYAFFGLPDAEELNTFGRYIGSLALNYATVWYLLNAILDCIIILLCLAAIHNEPHTKLISSTYAVIIFVFYVVPDSLQALTYAVTSDVYEYISDKMIIITIALAGIAQCFNTSQTGSGNGQSWR